MCKTFLIITPVGGDSSVTQVIIDSTDSFKTTDSTRNKINHLLNSDPHTTVLLLFLPYKEMAKILRAVCKYVVPNSATVSVSESLNNSLDWIMH